MSMQDSQELTSFFEKLTAPPPILMGKETEAMREFNSLFEKLSSLDELTWEPENKDSLRYPNARKSLERGTPARKLERVDTERARLLALSRRKRGEIRIGQSNADAGTASGKVAAATAVETARPQQADVQRGVATAIVRNQRWQRSLRVLKIVTVGLVLFGLGLGGVWLAMSFPKRFENNIPGISSSAKPKQAATRTAQTAAVLVGRTDVEFLRPKTLKKNPPAKPAKRTESLAAVAGVIPQVSARGAKANVLIPPLAPIVEKIPSLHTLGFDKNMPAAPDAEMNRPFAVTEPSATRTRYAIQVGACSSQRCLDNYRNLLEQHVSAESIHYVPVLVKGSGRTVQRVRVEFSNLKEAKKVKDLLISTDAQLEGSYVITLN